MEAHVMPGVPMELLGEPGRLNPEAWGRGRSYAGWSVNSAMANAVRQSARSLEAALNGDDDPRQQEPRLHPEGFAGPLQGQA